MNKIPIIGSNPVVDQPTEDEQPDFVLALAFYTKILTHDDGEQHGSFFVKFAPMLEFGDGTPRAKEMHPSTVDIWSAVRILSVNLAANDPEVSEKINELQALQARIRYARQVQKDVENLSQGGVGAIRGKQDVKTALLLEKILLGDPLINKYMK